MENQIDINSEDIKKVSAEVLDHMMNPRNYGVMEDSTAIGKAIIVERDEFVMIYIKVKDGILENITFGMDGNQDTSVAGSIFTEMVKGDTLENAIESLRKMTLQISTAPKNQQIMQGLVLSAFRAAIVNMENKAKGIKEDMCVFEVEDEYEKPE